jgi:hypothetical protein
VERYDQTSVKNPESSSRKKYLMQKKTVPKKNVEPLIVDIRKSDFNYERLRGPQKLDLTRIPQATPPRFVFVKRVVISVLLVVLFGLIALIVLTVVNLRSIKAVVTENSEQIIGNFTSSASALKNLEAGTAVDLLEANSRSFVEINRTFQKGGLRSFLDTVGGFIPIVKDAFGFLGDVTNMNLTFLELAKNIQELEVNGFGYFQKDGQRLISVLESVHGLIQKIDNQSQVIKNSTSNLRGISPLFGRIDQNVSDQYLRYSSELFTWDKMLINLIGLLNSETDRHILVFFQNPSEIRPGGGFIGSYADITVQNGQMKQMDVRDIYDPDGQLDLKVIPPKQLQTLTTNWGARDANWFFDFPTSAENVIRLMESSKMYSEKNVAFEGAVALNINAVKDILSITGPIELADYQLVITQDNLLEEVQRSVEAGADKKSGQPKKILMKLAPILLQKIGELSETGHRDLLAKAKERLDKKDIMLYAKNLDIAAFLGMNDLDGSVFKLPNGFWGSYLAVVNANVAGGKSDAFIDEKISANVDLDTSGNAFTNVQITRIHNGNLQKDPWWKATNKNFIRVLTEPNSTLVSVTGNDSKPKYQTMDYANSDYIINPDLAEMEKGEVFVSNFKSWIRSESGKNAFATWLMLPAGESRTLNLRYETSYSDLAVLEPDKSYTFIFEKQAGVKGQLDVTMNAPFKYYWAESGDTAFHYATNDPDKRVILTLTLKKKIEE